jgi:hypothetical protein
MDTVIDTARHDNVAFARVVQKLGFAVERQVRYWGLNNIDVNLFARSL